MIPETWRENDVPGETPKERLKRMLEDWIFGNDDDLDWALRVCEAAIEAHEQGAISGASFEHYCEDADKMYGILRSVMTAIEGRDA